MIVKIEKKPGTYSEFTVTLSQMTVGNILAIKNALKCYSNESIIGAEVLEEWQKGIDKSKELKEAF